MKTELWLVTLDPRTCAFTDDSCSLLAPKISGDRQQVKRNNYRLHRGEHIFLIYVESSYHMVKIKQKKAQSQDQKFLSGRSPAFNLRNTRT